MRFRLMLAEIAWALCQLIYRLYAIILSAIFSFVYFKSAPMVVASISLGVAVDAWRFRQFLAFPSDPEVRKYGLVLAALVGAAIAAPMTLLPDVFGYLIAHTHHDYQMTIKITSDEPRAKIIFFTESFVLVSAYVFSLAQLIAFERGNYRHTEKTKIKKDENKPLLLLFILTIFLIFLGAGFAAAAIREASRLGPGLYLPHYNLLFLTHFVFCFYAFAFLVRLFMSIYRVIESEWRLRSIAQSSKPP